MALAHQRRRLAVRCGRACEDQRVRERWGCDRDTTEPAFSVVCWACLGDGRGCEVCDGEGRLHLRRCPGRCRTPDVLLAVRAWEWLQQGMLPVAGGMLDQTRVFHEACRILDAVASYYDAQKAEEVDRG